MSRFEDPVIICARSPARSPTATSARRFPTRPRSTRPRRGGSSTRAACRSTSTPARPTASRRYEIEDFRAITEAILAEVDDVIVNYSTGAIGVPIEKRIEYLRELKPDVAALNMSSMNYAKYSRRRKDFVFKAVFENSFDTIIEFLTAMSELGIQPEHECFDAGHIANLDPLIDMGLLDAAAERLAGDRGQRRHPAQRHETSRFMSEQIPGGAEGPNNWQVIGISRDQWRLIGAALALGGNVRAGPRGQPLPAERRDGALQRRPDRQGPPDGGGRRAAAPATVAEAREMLGGCRAPRLIDGQPTCPHERLPLWRHPRPRPHAAAARAASARCSWPTSAPTCVKVEDTGDGRLRPLGAALLRLRGCSRRSARARRCTWR